MWMRRRDEAFSLLPFVSFELRGHIIHLPYSGDELGESAHLIIEDQSERGVDL